MLFHQVFDVHPRLNHLIQAIDIYYTLPRPSGLLLQNALHNNHLFRTQLPNKHTESVRIARRAPTSKRHHMSLQKQSNESGRGKADVSGAHLREGQSVKLRPFSGPHIVIAHTRGLNMLSPSSRILPYVFKFQRRSRWFIRHNKISLIEQTHMIRLEMRQLRYQYATTMEQDEVLYLPAVRVHQLRIAARVRGNHYQRGEEERSKYAHLKQ
jgi:hypothetical protein